MSMEIDQRIVEMKFDNAEFERRISKTESSLTKLKQALNIDGISEGFDDLARSVNNISFAGLVKEFAGPLAKFKLISNALDEIIGKTEKMVKSVTIEPVAQGWDKYAKITTATQTIMAATAKNFSNEEEQMEAVNKQLAKLNWFTDETSYNLTDMTNNIGKFTSNGVDLEKAATAMQGIGTWASISGQGVQEASRAMYNLSQALGTGAVKTIDWMSIENANMATLEFKENVIESAVRLGTLTKIGDDLYQTMNGSEVSSKNFRENLKEGWFTSEVLMDTLNKYGGFANKLNEYYEETDLLTSDILDFVDRYSKGNIDLAKEAQKTGVPVEKLTEMVTELSKAEYDLGRKAFAAAQEAKTFEEAIAATTDAVSTGWMKTFQLVFGDYKQAKVIWTALANELYDVFAAPGEFRNAVLETWAGAVDEISGLNGRQMWFGDGDEVSGILGNIWSNVKSVAGAFNEAFATVFETFRSAEGLGEKLFNFSKYLRKITSELLLNEETVNKITAAFVGLMRPVKAVVDIVRGIAGPIIRNLLNIAGYFVKTMAPALYDVSALIDRLFTKVIGGSTLGKVTDGLERLLSGLTKISKKLIDLIAGFISIPAQNLGRGIGRFLSVFELTNDFVSSALSGMRLGFDQLILGIGRLVADVTGLDVFVDIAKNISDSFANITARISDFYKSIKKVYTGYGKGFPGVIQAILYTSGKAFKSITGWLSKITGIKWFDKLGQNAFANIQKIRTSFKEFTDRITEEYNSFGGGVSGGLKTAVHEVGNLASKGLNALADITGIEWFRTLGTKITAFFDNIKGHIDEFVESLSVFFKPITAVAGSFFDLLFGKEEKKLKDPLADVADSAEESAARTEVVYKSLSQMALEVIRGDWGNGLDRDNALWGAGYDNDRIQELVNKIWTLQGNFKEGYESILAEYENVDARMEGYILPVDDAKTKDILVAGKSVTNRLKKVGESANMLVEEGITKPVDKAHQGVTKTAKSIGDQLGDLRSRVLAPLPGVFTSIGKAVASFAIWLNTARQNIINFIETEHVIDKIADVLFTVGDAIRSVVTDIWSTIKAAAKLISGTLKGTGEEFSNLLSSIFSGDLKQIQESLSALFESLRKNFEREYRSFAAKISKTHDPITEIVKLVIISANAIVAAIKKVVGAFTGLFKSANESGKETISIFGRIKNFFVGIGNFFSTVFAGTKTSLENLQFHLLLSEWSKAGEDFKNILTKIRDNIYTAYPNIKETIDSISAFISKYETKIKNITATVYEFLKTVGSKAWNGVKTVWNTLSKVFANTGWTFKNVFDGILEGNIKKVQKNLVYLWNNIWANIKNVTSDAISSISAKYPKFGAVISSIQKFLSVCGPLAKNAAESIGKFLGNVGSTAWSGIKSVWEGLSKIFSGAGSSVELLTASLEDGDLSDTKGLVKNIAQNTFGSVSEGTSNALDKLAKDHPKIDKFIKFIVAVKDKVIGIFSKISNYFKKNGVSLKDSFLNGIKIIKEGITNIGPEFKKLFSAIFNFDLSTAYEAIKTIFNSVYEGIKTTASKIFGKISNFLGPLVVKALDIFTKGDILKNIGNGFSGFVKAIGEILKEIGSATSTASSNGTFTKIKDVILSLLSMMTTIGRALSMFRAAKMFKQFGMAARGFGGLAKSLKEAVDTKILKKKSAVNSFADTLKTFVIIFAVVAAVVVVLGRQDPAVLEQGMDAAARIALAIAGFMVVLKIVDKIMGKDFGGSFEKVGKAMLSMAAGLLIMYFAVKSFAKLDAETLFRGLGAVGLVLLEIGIFAKLISSKKGASIMDVGKQLVLTAIAMLVLYFAIKKFGTMDPAVLAQGFIAISAILLAFGIFAQFLRSKSGQVLKIGGTLIALAAAMYILTYSIDKLGDMNLKKLAKGVGAVMAALISMGISVRLMKNVKASTAVTILSLSLAIVVLTSAVQSLSKLSLGELAKGVGSITALMLVLGGTAALLSASKPSFGKAITSAIMLGEMLVVTYLAVKILEGMKDNVTLEKAAALSLVVATIGGIAALLSTTHPKFTSALVTAIVLGEMVLTAIGAAVALNMMDDSVTLEKAEALSAVIGVMGIVAAALVAMSPDLESAAAAAIAMIGVGASAIEGAAALNMLEGDGSDLLAKAEALSLVVGTMGGVAALLTLKGLSFVTGAKAAAGLVSFMGTFIGGMALLGGLKYGIDYVFSLIPEGIVSGFTGGDLKQITIDDLISNVIPSLEKFAEAFGTMAGKFTGSFKAAELTSSSEAMSTFFTDFTPPSEEQQQKVSGVVTLLSDLEKNLPGTNGVFQYWFGGGTSWSVISEGLADFGKALSQFSLYCLLVNTESVTKGAEAGKALSETLEGLPEKPGKISSWFEGTYEWSTISTGLADFGKALLAFSNASLLVNKAAVDKGAQAGASLATTLKALPMTPGKISAWFSGTYNWSTISDGLVDFGKALAGFSKKVKGNNVDYESVKTAASAGLELAKTLSALPESPGFVTSWFSEGPEWSTISTGLADFGTALKDFSINAAGVNADDLSGATTVADALVTIAGKIPVDGGLYGLIFGEHSIAEFAEGIAILGGALRTFSTKSKYIDTDASENGVTLAQDLVDISEKLPTTGGAMQWLLGEHNMDDFATGVGKLGDALVDYSSKAAKLDTTSVKFATTVAASIADTIGETQTYDVGLAQDLFDFAEALADSAQKFEGLDTTNILAVTNAFTSMSSANQTLQDSMASLAGDALNAFNNSLLSQDNASIYDTIGMNFAILVKNRLIGSKNTDARKKLLDECFKQLATDSIKAFSSRMTSESESGTLYDGMISGFRSMLAARFGSSSNADRSGILKQFDRLATASLTGFSDTLKSSETQDRYDTAISNFKTEIVGRLDGTTGTYRQDLLDSFNNLARDLIVEFSDKFSSISAVGHYNSAVNYLTTTVSALLVISGNTMVSTLASTIASGYNLIFHMARNAVQGVVDGVNSMYASVQSVGFNTMQGLINGMNAMAPVVNATAHAIGSNIERNLRAPLAVYSPSRVATEIGEFVDIGLINGLMNKSEDVQNAASYVSIGVADVMDGIIQNATTAMEQDANPTITPVVDMSNVTRSAGFINGMFAGGTWGFNASTNAARAARVGTMSVSAQQVTRDINYQDSLNAMREDIRGLSKSIANMQIVMDSGALVGSIAAPMDRALGRRTVHAARRN